jgi:hypothetical protein
MSNLIVTIISILLVAVVAMIGAYYMNTMMNPSIAQTRANMIYLQSRQLMASDMQYMLDKGLGDFNAFGPDTPAIANYTTGRVNILNLDTYGQRSTGIYPTLTSTTGRHVTLNSATPPIPGTLDGYPVTILRTNCNANNLNFIAYWMAPTLISNGYTSAGIDLSLASSVTHPLVQMCLKLNAMTKLPSGLTYAPSGLPYANSTSSTCAPGSGGQTVDYDSGFTQTNYCAIEQTGYFGTNAALLFIFGN